GPSSGAKAMSGTRFAGARHLGPLVPGSAEGGAWHAFDHASPFVALWCLAPLAPWCLAPPKAVPGTAFDHASPFVALWCLAPPKAVPGTAFGSRIALDEATQRTKPTAHLDDK